MKASWEDTPPVRRLIAKLKKDLPSGAASGFTVLDGAKATAGWGPGWGGEFNGGGTAPLLIDPTNRHAYFRYDTAYVATDNTSTTDIAADPGNDWLQLDHSYDGKIAFKKAGLYYCYVQATLTAAPTKPWALNGWLPLYGGITPVPGGVSQIIVAQTVFSGGDDAVLPLVEVDNADKNSGIGIHYCAALYIPLLTEASTP